MDKVLKREEISLKDKWNVNLIFKNDEEFEKEFELAQKEINELKNFENMIINVNSIKEFIDKLDYFERKISKLAIYAHMKHDEDTMVSKYSGYNSKMEDLAAKFSELTSFFMPKLLSLTEKELEEIKNSDKLKFYKQYLDDIIRYKPHTLTYNEEKIMAMSSKALDSCANAYSFLNNADMKFDDIKVNDKTLPLTHSSYGLHLVSDDREIRKQAFLNMSKGYFNSQNTLAALISGNIQSEIFDARVHKFNSALESSLFDDAVSINVLDSLIKAVNNSLPTLHEYLDFKRERLKLDELHLYDMYKPISSLSNKEYSYDEAIDIVLKALEPLGEDYINNLKRGLERGWIDKYENVGKRSGAYSTGCHDTEPYILLNFNGTLNSVFTMAHEIGHSMHSFYSRKNQTSLYSSYRIFVAEVASIFNETLLKNYLLKTAKTKEEKFSLLNKYLENFRTTMFRQTMFAEYEKFIYSKAEEGVPLTVDNLNSWYYDLNKRYFGPKVTVDKEISIEWARIPHFYYNFYVYKYAIGFAASSALAKMVTEGGEKELNRYLGFLSAGSSDYPLNILKTAGVNLESTKPIDDALELFKSTLSEIKSL